LPNSSKKSKVDWVSVGASVPQHFADYLTLFAHKKDISKSSLLRSLIQSLMEEGPSITELIQLVAEQEATEWDRRVNVNAGTENWTADSLPKRLKEFLQERREALKKNIPQYLVTEIMRDTEQLCKEQIKS
jgi:hypothetical protein